MIRSFYDDATEDVFNGVNSRAARRACPQTIWRKAQVKLDMLNAARTLGDLTIPPGNQLEPLKGRRKGQHSIRINDQYRICFVWTGQDAERVEITDYHDER